MTPKENQTNDELELDDGNNEEGKSSKKGKTHLSKKEKPTFLVMYLLYF